MKSTLFLIIAVALILVPFLACKKSNTSCANTESIVCTSIDGTIFAANTYSSGFPEYWQQGSYATRINGVVTIIGGNISLQTWVALNVYAVTKVDSVYSPAKGNLTCTYGALDPNHVIPYPNYAWKDLTSSGTLVITKMDTVANVMSGTFSGFTVNALVGQTPSTHSITNGAFNNIPINPL